VSDDVFHSADPETSIPWWRTLLQLLGSFVGSALTAAEAFGAPPHTRMARNHRLTALFLFVGGAILLLTAAVIDVFGNRIASEAFGWAGISCFYGSAFCGLRYPFANSSLDDELEP
jgi:hypothetical protein